MSIKKIKSGALITADEYFRDERHRVDGKPKLFLKAGVTNRDTFQTITHKVTHGGKDLIEFAYGVLTADTIVEVPTSTGTRKAVLFRGIEITAKEKIWAVEFLANRGFGKAEQTINISATIENKSTDELKQEALKLLHKVTKVQDAIESHRPAELKTVIDVASCQDGERQGKC